MSCCQSQNREHKCDGAGGYDEDHNAGVRKKHAVHHAPPYLCVERRRRSLNALAVICDLGSRCVFSYMGKIREPVMCSSWQTWNQKKLWRGWNNLGWARVWQSRIVGGRALWPCLRRGCAAYSAQPLLFFKSSIQADQRSDNLVDGRCPLWIKSRHVRRKSGHVRCTICAQKQTCSFLDPRPRV
jgi:hypothetical protein